VNILFVDVALGFAEQIDVKMASSRHILKASCRLPTVEVLTVTSPTDEIFANAESDPFVEYFNCLIGVPVS